MGKVLIFDGRPEEGVEFIKKAMRLDPLYPAEPLCYLGLAHFCMGQLEEAVSLIDIFPTLVDIIEGNSGGKYNLTGQSLLPLIEKRPWQERLIFSSSAFRVPLKYSLIDGRYKMIKYAHGDVIGLYDLENDPNELQSLDPDGSFPFRLMSARLSRLIAETKNTNAGEAKVSQPDEQDLKDLRSLGYVQ